MLNLIITHTTITLYTTLISTLSCSVSISIDIYIHISIPKTCVTSQTTAGMSDQATEDLVD
ncbi:hypothetical protein BDW42DRAFT_160928 [Aspergillus taichungensis]|uniref:Uncharacterized protein n=1 Tax=Aspergillus taichungensis TaxID=482145 RepID=A0A2J5I5V9_9EURO|nr:hypothetical protein BDW42DRAFT_160928 [Aspergillus taichungensis]